MTIRIILKNGVEFSVKCEEFALKKNGFGEVVGYDIVGITENKPLYIAFDQVAAIIRVISDEVPKEEKTEV